MSTLLDCIDGDAHVDAPPGDNSPGQGGVETSPSETPKSRNLTNPLVTTSRRVWRQTPRKLCAVDVGRATLVDQGGHTLPVRGRLADVLRVATGEGCRWVLVCDADSVQLVREWSSTTPPDGWVVVSAFVDDRSPTLDLKPAEGGRIVRISTGQQWTGETVGAHTTAAALDQLRSLIAEAWRPQGGGGTLLGTPATTGRDLMARCLPDELSWPVLSDEWAETIREASGQHRMELVMPVGREVPAMYELDARLAYAGVTWGLPVGEPTWRRGEPSEDEWRGRWRGLCSWTVPEDWTGPGLLPSRLEDRASGWEWASTPGERHTGWLDGCEADLARRYGWDVHVREHIAWPKGPDPLRTWTEKLVTLWKDVGRHESTGDVSDSVGQVLRYALRAILLHGIGSLQGRGQVVSHTWPVDRIGEVPAHALTLQLGDDQDDAGDSESIVWTERQSAAWPEMCRPEWTSTIYARMRCRLLDGPGARWPGQTGTPRTGALHLPGHVELVGFRGDCLYLTDDPGWRDDGAVGRFRVKRQHPGFRMPHTLAELDDIRNGNDPDAATGAGFAAFQAARAAFTAKLRGEA